MLAGELTDENRRLCVTAAEPLMEGVEQLNIFASSTEFVSTPARISQQGCQAQVPILKVRMFKGATVHAYVFSNRCDHVT